VSWAKAAQAEEGQKAMTTIDQAMLWRQFGAAIACLSIEHSRFDLNGVKGVIQWSDPINRLLQLTRIFGVANQLFGGCAIQSMMFGHIWHQA
jgi:hypothetical protein